MKNERGNIICNVCQRFFTDAGGVPITFNDFGKPMVVLNGRSNLSVFDAHVCDDCIEALCLRLPASKASFGIARRD